MSQRFVNVEEIHPFGRIIPIDGLQTGDVSKKRRSSEAAEDDDRIVSLKAVQSEGFAVFVDAGNVGQGITNLEAGLGETPVKA